MGGNGSRSLTIETQARCGLDKSGHRMVPVAGRRSCREEIELPLGNLEDRADLAEYFADFSLLGFRDVLLEGQRREAEADTAAGGGDCARPPNWWPEVPFEIRNGNASSQT